MVNWQEPGMSMNMAQSIVDQMGGTGAAGVEGWVKWVSMNMAQSIADQMGGTGAAGVGKMSVQEHGSIHWSDGGGGGLEQGGVKWVYRNMAQSIVDQMGGLEKQGWGWVKWVYRNMAQSIVDQMGGTGAARVVGEGGKMSGNIAQLIVHGKGGGGDWSKEQ